MFGRDHEGLWELRKRLQRPHKPLRALLRYVIAYKSLEAIERHLSTLKKLKTPINVLKILI